MRPLLAILLSLALLALAIANPWRVTHPNLPHTDCPCDACNGKDLTPTK